jgi:hypothetical protein
MKAQGNALGKRVTPTTAALKGQNKLLCLSHRSLHIVFWFHKTLFLSANHKGEIEVARLPVRRRHDEVEQLTKEASARSNACFAPSGLMFPVIHCSQGVALGFHVTAPSGRATVRHAETPEAG